MVKVLLVFFALVLLGGCEDSKPNQEQNNKARIESIWPQTVSEYMLADLWLPEYNYDAGHMLMVPLHYAFAKKDEQKIQEFDDFYIRYSLEIENALDVNRLRQLQFWYLLSQYLVLSKESGHWTNVHQHLHGVIADYLTDFWFFRPIGIWGINTIGLKERIIWKLESKDYEPKYKLATIDEEFFTFAIAADLLKLNKFVKEENYIAALDIQKDTLRVFESEVVNTSNGWLYQPGQWDEYQDYIYAGHTTLSDQLTPKPVKGIALDSSHAHRFVLWLVSFRDSYTNLQDEYIYFDSLYDGFISQFKNVIYVEPDQEFDAMRMKNYSDGNNGIYRYRYHEDNPGAIKLGYEPYNLSGTLFAGFYPLSQDSYIKGQYQKQCNKFPLEQKVVDLYMGLGPTRATHELASMPDYFENGFAELVCLTATQM
ncbi:hypothetical protein [Pseudoalteromonas piratica]|uniref:Lipoprotein n=1 Tax=Pseudoalteromonas piratica TaxID=1348114 RepID=A0A0A7ED52_9GAMM|nr:hypothetical protein [Pseudoalteromonas piratica]AIY64570.1 hypothetical protein OM33_04965 [Pseudoalteromonas piratica]